MAEVPGGEGGGGGRHQKRRAKKQSTKIDMTPMVDLAFLLLTFFILTTTMYKPSTLQLTFPVPPEEDVPQDVTEVNNAFTLLLTKKDQIFWYEGEYKPGVTTYTRSNFKDIRGTLLAKNNQAVQAINRLTQDFNAGKLQEEAYDSLRNQVKKQEYALYCIIKPDKDAKYRNMIDVVDEMDITGVGKYAVVDVLKPEEQAQLDQEKLQIQ
jgi:biopolymer transport protein ExbD